MEGIDINGLNKNVVAEQPNNLDDVKKRIEELEKEYPKLFGPRPPAASDAHYGLEKASTSEWINDEIEIIQTGLDEETTQALMSEYSDLRKKLVDMNSEEGVNS